MDIFRDGSAASASEAAASPGSIALCPHKGCNFCCTEFTSGNYIVLYPGELAKAERRGLSISHLKLIDADYHGGARAVCEAKDRKTCDGGYKPLDCASYPFFPDAPEPHQPVNRLLKGTKCPLTPSEIREHERWVKDTWTQLTGDDAIRQWLNKVLLVGYERAESGSDEVLPTEGRSSAAQVCNHSNHVDASTAAVDVLLDKASQYVQGIPPKICPG